jgi:signal transduction histidine kinase
MRADTDADVLRLQTALRDLVALSAIPAAWIGSGPAGVAVGLADALVGLLQLDFAFVRLCGPDGSGAVDVARGSAWKRFPEWLEEHSATSIQFPGITVVADVGDDSEPCRAVAFPIGVNGSGGLVAVASERSDFPTAIERMLLSLAANQGATAFQNAHLIDERKRTERELRAARHELEVTVTERTAELLVANDALSALRRVATLVAEGVQPLDLFAVVAEEVARVVDVPLVMVARYEPDGTATECAGFPVTGSRFPVGKRWSLEGTSVLRLVRERSESARIDDYSELKSELADLARRSGLRSTVGVPVVVAGRVWGAIVVSTTEHGELPHGTETRLADFTELLATAIANAESREALARLADEQAALRRVAVLVARQPSPDEVFTAVTEEVGRLLGADLSAMHIFLGDGTATTIAGWSAAGPLLPIGTRLPLDRDSVASRIFHTGAAARMDSYLDVQGETAEVARGMRLRSTVGAPILVDGSLWGALMAATRGVEALTEDAETRIAGFTELVATAVSNAQAREALRRLADEQAALRRVATLVAKEASPAELFAKVAEEAGNVLGNVDCGLLRDERDGTATVVAAWGAAISTSFPVGARLPVDGDGVVASVLREGKPRRIDDYSTAPAIAEGAREHGIRSAVGCPILVRGGIWGAMVVANSRDAPCQPETERRITQFADLVATAIANADARAEVERLADEQAALRRVATLVAQGVAPAEIFAAVSDEVAGVFGSGAAVLRFDRSGPSVVFVGVAKVDIPVGTRWAFHEGMASAEVYRTGRPARVDAMDWSSASGPVAEAARRLGVVSTVVSPIVVEGRLWGAMSVSSMNEPLPLDIEERVERFTELVATAISNAESREELAASRRRIVGASDEARRRIERDLHDGTQQRLVSLALAVRAAEAQVQPDGSDLRSELSHIATGLADAIAELQELSRGIHPAILSQGGLGPALRTLARRSPIPVELDLATDARLPEPIEVAAYYVASEALANAAKHAQASRVEMSLALRDGSLLLSIRDDGAGGADPARGSGLVGLSDRVEALGGSIQLGSRPGDGTQVTAELPVGPDLPRDPGPPAV